MFDVFTDRALRVVVLASEEARALGHDDIDPPHFRLALLAERDDAWLNEQRQRVAEVLGRGEPTTGHIPFTRRTKRALELSVKAASDGEVRGWVGPEHIALGLDAEQAEHERK